MTFNKLRQSANLILTLVTLMKDSNVSNIKMDAEKATTKVEEKFALENTEEEAMHQMRELISSSINAMMPQVMEKVHKWAQYWRK